MINFLADCSFCKDSAVFSIIYLVRKILGIVFIIVPIILIVLLLIDIAKNVVAAKEDDMKKNQSIAIKRIIYAIAIFLVPTIVNVFMNVLYKTIDNKSEASFLECWNNANDVNKVSQCNAEVIANEIAADTEKRRLTNEKLEKYNRDVEVNKHSGGLTAKNDNENSDGNSNNDITNNIDSSNNNLPSTLSNYTVYTGDSRANLMCLHTELVSAIGAGNANERCITAPGKAYTYFHGTIVKELESVLKSHNNANIVFSSWGTNDISPNIYKNKEVTYPGTYFSKMYATDYKNLANKYPNAKFIVVSITYFDESKSDVIGYRIKNILADNFNKNMQANISGVSNIVYCDINKVLGNNYTYSLRNDGIHYYTNEDNKKILDEIRKCI